MREIKDAEGRTWQLALTVSAIMRVRDVVKVVATDGDGKPVGNDTGDAKMVPLDLANIQQISDVLTALKVNYTTLGEVLYAALLPQVESRKLTREEFLDGLSGDSLDAASGAIIDELIDFFPRRHRRVVRMMVDRYDELQEQAVTSAEEQVAQSGMPSGNAPGSSASTQETGPTGSSKPRPTRGSKTTGGTRPTFSA